MTFTMTAEIAAPYEQAVERARAELTAVGFGVLTEIDMAATLQAKLGVTIAPKVILGACRPQLAHQAVEADPRVAALLPCNVVVSAVDPTHSRVEVLDPAMMSELSPAVADVAAEARSLLEGFLKAMTTSDEETPDADRA